MAALGLNDAAEAPRAAMISRQPVESLSAIGSSPGTRLSGCYQGKNASEVIILDEDGLVRVAMPDPRFGE